jgi:hypothetical protein
MSAFHRSDLLMPLIGHDIGIDLSSKYKSAQQPRLAHTCADEKEWDADQDREWD